MAVRIGKLSNDDLDRLVLSKIRSSGSGSGPGIGLDCAVLPMGDGRSLVLSADPVTAAGAAAGRIAVHISCNDIASAGIRPAGLMTVLILPPSTTETDVSDLVEQIASAADELDVPVSGGHTEISATVDRPLVVTTAFGWSDGPVVLASGGQIGDTLIMTKTAGLEGTAILVSDKGDALSDVLSLDERKTAEDMINRISVLQEGLTGARCGVHAMHDVTEGGILGACWELCRASGTGCTVWTDDIPVHPLTVKIARHFRLDPLRLISSGSMLLATDQPETLLEALQKDGIEAAEIGRLEGTDCRITHADGCTETLLPPQADELYKTLDQPYYEHAFEPDRPE